MVTTTKPLELEIVDSVAVYTLNRPEKLNAMNGEVFELFLEYLERCREPDVRAILLRGKGRAFCAGDDLSGTRPPTNRPRGYGHYNPSEAFTRASPYQIWQEMRYHPKPIVAAIHGYCVAAGADLALAADFRIVADNTQFGLVYIRRALVGGTWLLEKYVGLGKATELLLTGNTWDAAEVDRWGLATKVVPLDSLEEESLAYARMLASGPTKPMGYAKEALNRGMNVDIKQGLEYMIWANGFAANSEDSKEGRASFLEKREARFTGL
jgi:enoyl-CoA hydratase/carnithine racemase